MYPLPQEPTRAAVALFSLLHEPVVGATATDQGGLLLTFKSGVRLEVLDTSAEYESFWISHGSHLIVV
jgi:hypothetical protein